MPIRKIQTYGSSIVRSIAKRVETIDSYVVYLAHDMAITMQNRGGIGISANQVGEALRIMVIGLNPEDNTKSDIPIYMINPEILEKSGCVKSHEGCLSVPFVMEVVDRCDYVKIKYTNMDGEDRILEANNLFAFAVQHEIDHLDGILFIDKLPPVKRDIIKGKIRKAMKRL